MKNKIKIIFSIVIFLVWPNFSLSAPSISGVSGTVSDGESVTISGSSFGTKFPASPQLWVPFDSNKNSSLLGVVTSWRVSDAGIIYSAGSGWSGGSAQIISDPHLSSLLAATFSDFNFNDSGQKFYIHRRAKRLFDTTAMGGNGGLKSMKFDYNESYQDNVVLNLSTCQYNSQNYSGDSYYYLNSFNTNNPNWVTEETFGQSNIISNEGAKLDFYENYNLRGSSPNPNWITLWVTGTQPFNTISFWRYASSSPMTAGEAPEFWDDLYVDNTWARIIVSNASTLSASTHREIQIPSAWSANSITATINQGSFSNGAIAYLYVVDANGEVNVDGFPIIINFSDAIAPNAPIGLGVL
ncbi:MAG: hypothetical protein V3574_00090 [Candidatus Moraniibacteriota bacterium]